MYNYIKENLGVELTTKDILKIDSSLKVEKEKEKEKEIEHDSFEL